MALVLSFPRLLLQGELDIQSLHFFQQEFVDYSPLELDIERKQKGAFPPPSRLLQLVRTTFLKAAALTETQLRRLRSCLAALLSEKNHH